MRSLYITTFKITLRSVTPQSVIELYYSKISLINGLSITYFTILEECNRLLSLFDV